MKKNMSIRTLFTVASLMAALVGTAGPTVAQVIGVYRVPAFGTHRHTVWAPAGDSTVIVDGDGDTDLDCFVRDRVGRLLGSDADSTDYCIVDIWQSRSGNVNVEIRNLGRVYNEYILSAE